VLEVRQGCRRPFAKLKAALRKAAQRTVDELWDTIGRLVDAFTPKECANYFTGISLRSTMPAISRSRSAPPR
jgi:hypothetical protein